MISIFLSHSSNDKQFVKRLHEDLYSHGIKSWYSEAEIKPGDSLIDKIGIAIKECTYLGVILSPNSVRSEWVKREVNIALTQEIYGKKVKVIPILFIKCEIPEFLAGKLYVDFTTDFEEGLKKLMSRFDEHLHSENYLRKRIYDILLSAYQDWKSFDKQEIYLLKKEILQKVIQFIRPEEISLELKDYIFQSMTLFIEDVSMKDDFCKKWLLKLNFDETCNVFNNVFVNRDPKIRFNSLVLFEEHEPVDLSKLCIDTLLTDTNFQVQRALINYVIKRNSYVANEVLLEVYNKSSDWLVKSNCLKVLKNRAKVFLVSDNSEFAEGLKTIFEEINCFVVVFSTYVINNVLNELSYDLIKIFDLIILIRGEHFQRSTNNNFYSHLKKFINNGGILLATPWVSWESKHNSLARDYLPFEYNSDNFFENSQIVIQNAENKLGINILENDLKLYASYEFLDEKDDSITLLKISNDTPFLGFIEYGLGYCFYMNICQHSCHDEMDSPFNNPEFYNLIKKFAPILFKAKSGLR